MHRLHLYLKTTAIAFVFQRDLSGEYSDFFYYLNRSFAAISGFLRINGATDWKNEYVLRLV